MTRFPWCQTPWEELAARRSTRREPGRPKVITRPLVDGVPNDDLGEEVNAVIQPMRGVEPDEALTEELLGFCRQHPRASDGAARRVWGDGSSHLI